SYPPDLQVTNSAAAPTSGLSCRLNPDHDTRGMANVQALGRISDAWLPGTDFFLVPFRLTRQEFAARNARKRSLGKAQNWPENDGASSPLRPFADGAAPAGAFAIAFGFI